MYSEGICGATRRGAARAVATMGRACAVTGYLELLSRAKSFLRHHCHSGRPSSWQQKAKASRGALVEVAGRVDARG